MLKTGGFNTRNFSGFDFFLKKKTGRELEKRLTVTGVTVCHIGYWQQVVRPPGLQTWPPWVCGRNGPFCNRGLAPPPLLAKRGVCGRHLGPAQLATARLWLWVCSLASMATSQNPPLGTCGRRRRCLKGTRGTRGRGGHRRRIGCHPTVGTAHLTVPWQSRAGARGAMRGA